MKKQQLKETNTMRKLMGLELIAEGEEAMTQIENAQKMAEARALKEKDIAILNCTHTFHYKCIGEWMNSIKKNNFEIKDKFCPTCMNGDEIVNIVCREKYIPKKKKLNNKVNILKKNNFNKIIIKTKDKCIIS